MTDTLSQTFNWGPVSGEIVVQGNLTARGNITIISSGARGLYQDLVSSPKLFGNLQENIKSNVTQLITVLDSIGSLSDQDHLPRDAELKLLELGGGCRATISELQKLASQFETWDTQHVQQPEINALAKSLRDQIDSLEEVNLLSLSVNKLEKTVRRWIDSVKRGDQSSIITTLNNSQLCAEESDDWHLIQKELEGFGITAEQFNSNKEKIIPMLTEAFKEELENDANSDSAAAPMGGVNRVGRFLASITGRNRALFTAIESEDVPGAEAALLKGAFINAKGHLGRTPLHFVSSSCNVSLVKLLLKHRADTRIFDAIGYTALCRMCLEASPSRGRLNAVFEIVTLLLDHGADINATNAQSYGPIFAHSWIVGARTLKLLLERGANANEQNSDGHTPLHIAASWNDTDAITVLIEAGINANIKSRDGRTPLQEAVLKGKKDATRSLLEAGADVNIKDDGLGRTPLHEAVSFGNLDVIKWLLALGADINIKNGYGQTPLHEAVTSRSGGSDVTKLLLEAKADVSTKDTDGRTPLHKAVNSGNVGAVKLLLESRAGANMKNSNGETPLYEAVNRTYINSDVTELLLKFGADVSIKNRNGQTPLHQAVQNSNIGIVRILLNAGADINMTDSRGETPLHKAVYFNRYVDRSKVTKLLLDTGADVDTRNGSGQTPLGISIAEGYPVRSEGSNLRAIEILLRARANVDLLSGRERAMLGAMEVPHIGSNERYRLLGGNHAF